MDVDPGYKHIEKFCGDLHWYIMKSKDFFQVLVLDWKIENNPIVWFIGQSRTFRLTDNKV